MPNLHVPEHVWLSIASREIREAASPALVAGTVAILIDAFPHVPDDDWIVKRLPNPAGFSLKPWTVVEIEGRLDENSSVFVQLEATRNEKGIYRRQGTTIDQYPLWPENDFLAWLAVVNSLWKTKGKGWREGVAEERLVLLDSRTAHPWFIERGKKILINWRQNGVCLEPGNVWLFPVSDMKHGGFSFQGLPKSEQPELVLGISGAIALKLISLKEET